MYLYVYLLQYEDRIFTTDGAAENIKDFCLRKNHLPVAPDWVNCVKNIDESKTKLSRNSQNVYKALRFTSKARDVVHGRQYLSLFSTVFSPIKISSLQLVYSLFLWKRSRQTLKSSRLFGYLKSTGFLKQSLIFFSLSRERGIFDTQYISLNIAKHSIFLVPVQKLFFHTPFAQLLIYFPRTFHRSNILRCSPLSFQNNVFCISWYQFFVFLFEISFVIETKHFWLPH